MGFVPIAPPRRDSDERPLLQWPPRFPLRRGMCYNLRAVKDAGKQETAPAELRGAAVAESAGNTAANGVAAQGHEDASRYCPICSQRLESRRCKLVCNGCGYYMSCADYY